MANTTTDVLITAEELKNQDALTTGDAIYCRIGNTSNPSFCYKDASLIKSYVTKNLSAPITISDGGTGATNASTALTNLGAAPAFTSKTGITINDTQIQIYDISPDGTEEATKIKMAYLSEYQNRNSFFIRSGNLVYINLCLDFNPFYNCKNYIIPVLQLTNNGTKFSGCNIPIPGETSALAAQLHKEAGNDAHTISCSARICKYTGAEARIDLDFITNWDFDNSSASSRKARGFGLSKAAEGEKAAITDYVIISGFYIAESEE